MKQLFLLFTLLTTLVYAQPPIQWENALGGTRAEGGFAISQTDDGGYFTVGYTSSTDGDVISGGGPMVFWIVKVDADGFLVWETSVGGAGTDVALDVDATTDGGCIVVGHTNSTGGDVSMAFGSADVWVIKLSSTGIIEWEKSFGGIDSDTGRSVQQTADGGYILGGFTSSSNIDGHRGASDCWVIKLAPDGTMEWDGVYGGTGGEEIFAIQQTSDNGYVFAGISGMPNGDVTRTLGPSDCWVVRLDEFGAIIWEKAYGGNMGEFAYDIKQTADNGFIVAGSTASSNGDVTDYKGGYLDAWVFKINASGTITWQKTLGGSNVELLYGVALTEDGGYIVTGYTESDDGDVSFNHGINDVWVVKLTAEGDIDWEKTLGGSIYDVGYDVIQADDGGYVITGYSQSLDGDVSGGFGGQDLWVVKLHPEEKEDPVVVVEPEDPVVLEIPIPNAYLIPNVFTPNGDGVNDVYQIKVQNSKQIDLVIINRWGNTVFKEKGLNPIWDGSIRGENCTDGTYFLKYQIIFENDEKVAGQSIVQVQR